MSRSRLLEQCESFMETYRLSASRFGREACRDPRFIFDLRRGREPSGRVADRVWGFMRRIREADARSLTKGTVTDGKTSKRRGG